MLGSRKLRDVFGGILERHELVAAGQRDRIVERALPALWRHQANISAPAALNFTQVPGFCRQSQPNSTARAMPARNWAGVRPSLRKTAVDQLDVNAAVLDHLDGVRALHELTRGGADQVRPLIARHAKIRIQAPMKPAMR